MKNQPPRESGYEVASDWKHIWMNQRQNSNEDFENYHRRAFGIDANMTHHLGKMIDEHTSSALEHLNKKCEMLVGALEMYAMTNETFPEYGDVARKALANFRKDNSK